MKIPAKLVLKMPKRFRREFHLFLPGSHHILRFHRGDVEFKSLGIELPCHRNVVMDWLGESVVRVKCDLGDL